VAPQPALAAELYLGPTPVPVLPFHSPTIVFVFLSGYMYLFFLFFIICIYNLSGYMYLFLKVSFQENIRFPLSKMFSSVALQHS
jgi:hypothetical protein